METWEIEVDMRVRKTLRLSGPQNEATVREIVETSLTPSGIWPSFTHYDSEYYGILRPVERMIDNKVEIVSIKKVA